MGKNLYKLTKICDDVVVMLILRRHQNATAKNRRFLRVFAEYLKNSSTDFYQTYLIFRQSSIEVFEIKRLNTGHSLLSW